MLTLSKFINTCQTGDLILYSGKAWYSYLIEYLTDSPYSHISMVYRNPCLMGKKLNGLYIIEAKCQSEVDSIYSKPIFGTRLIPFGEACRDYLSKNGTLYYRKLNCKRDDEFLNRLNNALESVYGSSYDTDPFDWVKAEFNISLGNSQKDDAFWCSALIGYLYVKIGFLPDFVKWTIISPNQFSSDAKHKLLFTDDCNLEADALIQI